MSGQFKIELDEKWQVGDQSPHPCHLGPWQLESVMACFLFVYNTAFQIAIASSSKLAYKFKFTPTKNK